MDSAAPWDSSCPVLLGVLGETVEEITLQVPGSARVGGALPRARRQLEAEHNGRRGGGGGGEECQALSWEMDCPSLGLQFPF